MAEETLYQDDVVQITTVRLVLNATTFPLRNVASVKLATTPPRLGIAKVGILVGLVFLCLSMGCFIIGLAAHGMTMETLSIPVPLLAWGAIALIPSFQKIQRSKPNYHVAISSNSGEVNALTSQDQQYVRSIISSINDAIVRANSVGDK